MRRSISILILLVISLSSMAQKKEPTQKKAPAQFDTSYYVSYDKIITGRFYFSRKYTSFDLKNIDEGLNLKYKPNTTLNMGVGATYKWATLNLAYGFGFLNPDQGKGKTKYLDLQLHRYGRKVIIDLFGQFYQGFYLDDKALKESNGEYYHRPDIQVNEFGVSAQYLLNHGQFSYQAAFLQNEWQKKSAGTLLVGWELFFGRGKADSTLVPTAISRTVAESQLTQLNFIQTGPNIGYAYTLVVRKNFFITGALTLSLDVGTNTLEGTNGKDRSTEFSPNSAVRFFTGYNSETWAFSFTFVDQTVRIASGTDRHINLSTGNFRLNAVHRFKPGRQTRKVLKEIIN